MSENLRTTVILDLKGNLERNARRNSRAIKDMTRNSNRSLSNLNAGFKRHQGAVSGLIGRYKTLAVVAGIAVAGAAAKKVVGFDARLTQLGINANLDDEAIEKIKQNILSVAGKPGIRVDRNEILGGIEEIIKQTGQEDFATNVANIENIGKVISAAGATGISAGAVFAGLFSKFDLKKADDITTALNILAEGGKEGAFEFADFATQFNRVGAAMASTGRKGLPAVRELGAVMQMIRETATGSESASTNFERLMSSIFVEKVQELRDRGIDLSQSPPDIIKQIVTLTGGSQEKQGEVFEIRALNALRAFNIPFNRGEGFQKFNEILSIKGEGGILTANSLRKAITAESVNKDIGNSIFGYFDDLFSDSTKALAESFDKVDTGESNVLREAFNLGSKLGRKALEAKGLVSEEQKSSVDIHIKSDVPVTVKNLKSSSPNHKLNVDTGATMVGQ